MPGDIAVDSTSDYQMSEPNRLKEWRYRKRTQARKDRRRAKRRQKKEEGDRENGGNNMLYLHFFSSSKIASNGSSGIESSNPSSKSFIIPT